jgi:hypothetical protein
MTENDNENTCYFCKKGRFVKHAKDVAFSQWTDRGYIFCSVTIPVRICGDCGAMDWNDEAEAIIEDAVRRGYEKLP